ncbi:MAG: restriction endonuclease subunit S [Halanaerobiales bacterium]|nr:restriction endonuclease subunit S [Halanaerobiales bacterium]
MENILFDKIDSIFEKIFKIDKSILKNINTNQDDLNKLIIANLNRLDDKNITVLSKFSDQILSGLQHRDLDKIDQNFLIKGKNIKVMDITENKKKLEIKGDFKKRVLQTNDILIRIKGKVGPSTVVTSDIKDMYYYNDIARIRVNNDQVIPQYLSLYLNSFIGKYYLDNFKKTKSMNYIKISSLENLPILTPVLGDQWKIVQKFHVEKNISEVMSDD